MENVSNKKDGLKFKVKHGEMYELYSTQNKHLTSRNVDLTKKE